ncbi:hypothetical protein BMS3Abin02_01453 [bacterium BMS3Abin02]|nr:hypothetical protein BMS3Abin02_01453 [bacterium BMS3Abin02]GBE23045.1 hypothetical protein BMS3Bbin01_02425 [bacterium BMS3Bbin01]
MPALMLPAFVRCASQRSGTFYLKYRPWTLATWGVLSVPSQ